VNNRKTIWIEKLIAGFFLAVFLLVHAGKATHQHDTLLFSTKEISASSAVAQATDCSICDYHLTKDNYHFTGFPQVQNTEPSPFSSSFYHTPRVTSIGSASSGRGPPVLV
jgi:hypothetical protein